MQILSVLKVVKDIISRVYSVHHLVYSHLPHREMEIIKDPNLQVL